MKSPVAYYLLLLYLTVALKPMLPVASDACAHLFNEFEHIATIHAKYGSEHLQKEMANNEDAATRNQHSLKSQDDVSYHVCIQRAVVCCEIKTDPTELSRLQHQWVAAVYISKHSPPPKFS